MNEPSKFLRYFRQLRDALRFLGGALAGLLAFASPGRADSRTAQGLAAAVEAGDLARVQALLDQGVSPDSRNRDGVPILAIAARQRRAEIVVALLAKGADVHARVRDEAESSLDFPVVGLAVVSGSEDTLRLLLQAGASPNEATRSKISPLMVAALHGNLETLKVLLAAKAEVEARDSDRLTPLMWAANRGQYEAARLLLDAGAQVNARGELDSPPLMYAAQGGYDDVVALLIERGADPSLKATPGLTALDIARQNKHHLTVQLLQNGGRLAPPEPHYLLFRPLLFPEAAVEAAFLDDETKDPALASAKTLAQKGDYRSAVEAILAAPELPEAPEVRASRLWALAYLYEKTEDRSAAGAVLHKLLASPDLDSRSELHLWKLLRDRGEAPPPERAKRVLGVVVELGVGTSVLTVAAFADGTPRLFGSAGAGLIGDNWKDTEREKAQEVVRLAEGSVASLQASEDRELPKPGRTCLTVLTPGGSYRADWSASWGPGDEKLDKLFQATRELAGLLNQRFDQPARAGEN